MNIGFLGLGNLGMPLALSFNLKGHKVIGFDLRPERMSKENFTAMEVGPNYKSSVKELLPNSSIEFADNVEILIKKSDIIFIAVQTPNYHGYDGTVSMPYERKNYNLNPILLCMMDVNRIFKKLSEEDPNFPQKIVVINSTLLPGTIRKEFSNLDKHIILVHNPMFCAMGTVVPDMYNPEFVLLGGDNFTGLEKMEEFYKTINNATIVKTSFENAEMIKTCYNSFITMKVVYANTLMEIAHKIPGCDVDTVIDCLTLANERLISTKYLRGGMGDGGGCHPKENMALSWLAKEINLSYDLFESNMMAREKQTEWLADLICKEKYQNNLPVILLGISFKKETNLLDGSPGLLLRDILKKRGIRSSVYDPEAGFPTRFIEKAIYFVSMNHDLFKKLDYPDGSIIIDPWRYIPDQKNVKVVRIGEEY